MFIGADESLKIMRDSEECRAAALVKNQGRRVTVAGGEARDAGHPKRARTVTPGAPSGNGVFLSLLVCASRARALCFVYNLLLTGGHFAWPPIDTDPQLTWKWKIGELPAASSSVSGIKGICATSAASGVTPTPRATAASANSNLCGLGLGVVNQEVPSGKPSA